MSMGLREKRKRGHSLLRSFAFALQGIAGVVKTERNIKIHLASGIAVILIGWYFSVSRLEWLFLLTAIFGTIALELVNSAIERTVDLITGEIHPLAKQAKDIAAGAVFVYAIFSTIIGLIIFVPKIF
ncbi:diacylglycerol kinase family protein [Peribacillus glennii]|uniref:Diacylglycerol kinase family protein n=1 Tax=Peribacillus glennii TaxID=2303991 RepID=A0A372LHH9_9BACI|nr:diacylglycerol kinase family protein [Peribacillus glennii]RFU65748.1 diacylglycerol kinase family protein [Peribacillus glennii]